MRPDSYLIRPAAIVSLTVLSLTVSAVRPLAAPRDMNWQPTVEAALKAASARGKPLYVYVYASHNPRFVREGRDPKCVHMERVTLANPQVQAALGNYVLCALDIHNPDNESFLGKHNIVPAAEEEGRITTYQLPANLFLNSRGQEVYRISGYVPPQSFTNTLDNVRALIKAQEAVEANSQDAAAYARLGHFYLKLQRYEKARQYLNKAVALDPDNQTGAKAEANVDLAILEIADNPQQAYQQLTAYLNQYPQSPRRLEVCYYMGVALVAAGDQQRAIKVLQRFETSDKSAPEYDSPWTPYALWLLKQLRQPSSQ